MIICDLNRAVGSEQLGVCGNHDRVSYGGKLVREMIKEKDCILLNNMAEGGPWTWKQRGKEDIKSCLDLAICSRNLAPFVKGVLIDKEKQFTHSHMEERCIYICFYRPYANRGESVRNAKKKYDVFEIFQVESWKTWRLGSLQRVV